ncbi:MacB-like core domain-containing protein [Lachnospiraceae bacterium C7]|nr:MacB-like core domain-containing protein [Lachnospiraceae bacterium C7]
MIILKSGLQILSKHKFQTLLMIILSTILFTLSGSILTSKGKQDSMKKSYDNNFGKVTFYTVSENFSDIELHNYSSNPNKTAFNNICNFPKSLANKKEFKYTTLSSQMLNIYNKKIPNKFLYSYGLSDGNDDISTDINKVKGSTTYSVKSLQVSSNFFDIFNIKLESGRIFSDADYTLNKNTSVSVILGNEYKKLFKLNDEFTAEYMFNKYKFKVIGFIKEKSFFYNSAYNTMASCDRYAIIPAFTPDIKSDMSKEMSIDHVPGIISSKKGYEKTNEIFNNCKKENNISTFPFHVYNTSSEYNILSTYSSMTDEVANQFKIILCILTILSFIVNLSVFLNMLKENDGNFCIERLCGALQRDINLEAFVPVLTVLATSDLLGALILNRLDELSNSYMYVQVLILLIFTATCTVVHFYMKKIQLANYIGGKE